MLFKEIFRIAPEAQGLFYFTEEEGDIFDSPNMRKHVRKVVVAVDKAINGLNDLGTVAPLLTKLGTKHVGYGIKPEHYPIVGQAFINTLECGLGDSFYNETKKSYLIVYGIVADTMIGINYD